MNETFQIYLLAGMLGLITFYVGALVFGSGAVAPLVIRILGEKTGGPLLRAYWPRYHAFGVGGGALITLGAITTGLTGYLTVGLSLTLVVFAAVMTLLFAIGWRLIPAINHARDSGQHLRFNRLHRLDVMMVSAGPLIGLGLAAGVLATLPSQLG